jgi:hypothetical protein
VREKERERESARERERVREKERERDLEADSILTGFLPSLPPPLFAILRYRMADATDYMKQVGDPMTFSPPLYQRYLIPRLVCTIISM